MGSSHTKLIVSYVWLSVIEDLVKLETIRTMLPLFVSQISPFFGLCALMLLAFWVGKSCDDGADGGDDCDCVVDHFSVILWFLTSRMWIFVPFFVLAIVLTVM